MDEWASHVSTNTFQLPVNKNLASKTVILVVVSRLHAASSEGYLWLFPAGSSMLELEVPSTSLEMSFGLLRSAKGAWVVGNENACQYRRRRVNDEAGLSLSFYVTHL